MYQCLYCDLFKFTRPYVHEKNQKLLKKSEVVDAKLLHPVFNSFWFLAGYIRGMWIQISRIISADEDRTLRIESFAIINLRGVSTKLN